MFKKSTMPDVDFSAQFVVSGAEPGSYYVKINRARCASGQGDLKHPNSTVYCSTDSWGLVGNGELSPEGAVEAGLLRVSGSARGFSQFFLCFRLPTSGEVAFASYPAPPSGSPSRSIG